MHMTYEHVSPVCTRAFLATGYLYDILCQGIEKGSNSIVPSSRLGYFSDICSCHYVPKIRRYRIWLHQLKKLAFIALVELTACTLFYTRFSFSPNIQPCKVMLSVLYGFAKTQVVSITGTMKLVKDQNLYLSVVRYHNLVSTSPHARLWCLVCSSAVKVGSANKLPTQHVG